MTGKTDLTFSFDVVSCLLAAMQQSGTSVGNKQYALMAKIDGSKTSSGYEHMFRAAKNKAKEIDQKIATGELDIGTDGAKGKGVPGGGTPVKGKGGSKTATPASGAKKRGRKAASELEDGADEESPTKKMKE